MLAAWKLLFFLTRVEISLAFKKSYQNFLKGKDVIKLANEYNEIVFQLLASIQPYFRLF